MTSKAHRGRKSRHSKRTDSAARAFRRYLVLSASAGAGHLRAADAVASACRLLDPRADVRHVDVLTLTPAPFRRLYGRGYLDLVNRAPEFMGWLYNATNRPPRHAAADKIRMAIERLNTMRLARLVRKFAPDVVCHTHFLPAAILRHERLRGRFDAPEAVVVTDFDLHRFWLTPGAQLYCVAREDIRTHLMTQGVAAQDVLVTGIPIDPVFSQRPRITALRAKHRLDARKPLILVLCGGFGIGPIETLVEKVAGALHDAQIVVVAGRNEKLRKRLVVRTRNSRIPVRVIGYTNEMHEWMALAALIVTKPGGLTTSEALACGVPLVIANAIPGQETRNAIMLYEEGAAISGENPLTIGARIARLLRNRDRLTSMRKSALALARPRAALDVARALMRMAADRP